MPSTCIPHVSMYHKPYTSGMPQKKDLWRFLWNCVVPQEGSKWNQDRWHCPLYSCYLSCSHDHGKCFIFPVVKKCPLPPKHPLASATCVRERCTWSQIWWLLYVLKLEPQHILQDILGLTVVSVYCCRGKLEEMILRTKWTRSQV